MKPSERTKSGAGMRPGRGVWPPEVRVKMAELVVEHRLTAAVVSQSYGIPVTTVMDWAKRYRKGGPDALCSPGMRPGPAGKTSAARGSDVRRQAVLHSKRQHPEQGTRKIRDVLARFEGLGVSESTVRRVLHEEGLLEVRSEKIGKPRPAEHRFERAEPNQLWQSDIFTFLLRRHERLYVAAFMDDYSRYLVSLVVAHHQKSSLVMEALQRGIADYGAPREILTDQGRQYTAWRGSTEFEEELRRQGIRHIKSRPHHPQTCGKIERFWKTLWDEFLSRTVFADFADCERRVALFVQAYNFKRPHQGISGGVPADRFFRAAPQVRQAVEGQVAQNAMALAHERPRRPPFYLVGRLGDLDLSIALSGCGLLVRLGEREQVIALGKEEGDETAAARRVTEETGAGGAEMALEGGAGPSGQGEVPLDPERALGGEAGDLGDRGSEDFAGEVLPAGDAGFERDAALFGAGECAGAAGGGEPEEADQGPGGQGQGSGAGQEESGEAAAHDTQSDEGQGAENSLDPHWQRSFAELEEEDGPAVAAFENGGDWRGRALTWERKLAGEEGLSDGQELQAPAADPTGDAGALSGDGGGPVGGGHGEGGRPAAGPLPEPVSEPAAPGPGGTREWNHEPPWRPAAGPGQGEAPPGRAGGPATGERPAPQTSGDDGPSAGHRERPLAGPDGAADGEDEIGG